jgi:uncharacterized membrane protein YfcA
MSLTSLTLGLVMVFAAGLIRGFTGFGLSIAAVPLLSLILLPAQAIPIVLLPQLLVSLSGLRINTRSRIFWGAAISSTPSCRPRRLDLQG